MLHTDYTRKSRKKSNGIPIYAGGRVVAQVIGDKLYKSIAPNHFLKKPPAIAFDVQSLKDAEQAGAVWVEVENRETKQAYRAKITHIWEAGFEFDRGWGAQIALPMNGWIQSGQAIQGRLL